MGDTGSDSATNGGEWLAIDWGTSRRRAWRISATGEVQAALEDDRGVLAIAPGGFPAELASLRNRLGQLPALAAGMVGSNRGWVEAPYQPLPAGLPDLATRLTRVPGEDLSIVPGLADTADVMRGEEVQLLGAVEAGLLPPDALVCQPGTHNKWAKLEGGRITGFTTVMTGELFALLKSGGVLAGMLDADATDGPAFRAGVAEAAEQRDLSASLFKVRAAVLLKRLPLADAASYASGLLIGADVAPRLQPGPIHILAAQPLAGLYAAAIDTLGGHSLTHESGAAFLAGMRRIRELSA